VDRRDRGVRPAHHGPARLAGAAAGLGQPAWQQVAGVLLGRPFADRMRERDREPRRGARPAAGFWRRIASFRMLFVILNGPAHHLPPPNELPAFCAVIRIGLPGRPRCHAGMWR